METKYLIWSEEHGAWWRERRNGYTRSIERAGRYDKSDAEQIVKDANRSAITPAAFNEVAMPDPL